LLSILLTGILATFVFLRVSGSHCSESLVLGSIWGPPLGFALATATLTHLRRGQWARTTAIALAVGIGAFLVCLITFTNLLGTIDVGKQRYTMSHMREIAQAIQEGRSVEAQVDGWGTPYLIRRDGANYTIVSFGNCGIPDLPRGSEYSIGPTNGFEADIVLINGQFTRYPLGSIR